MQKVLLTFISLAFLLNIYAQPTNALHFNNSYVDINNISQKLSPLNKFTIEFWVKYNGFENTDYNAFYGVNASDYTNRFLIRASGPVDGVQRTAVVLLHRTNPIYLKGNTIIDDFECHHIAFTYDNQVCKLYIDGNLEATLNYSFYFSSNDIHSLGQEYDPPNVLSEFYNGMMDDFRIWNYARTQAEISANKSNELVGNEVGLIVNYDFNQGVPGGNNTSISSLFNKADPIRNGTLMNFNLNGPTSNFIDGNCVICDLNIDNVQIIDATCGNSNGKITISYSGETTGLTFSIDDGATYQNSNVFNNLASGTYQVKTTDDSGCFATQTVTVGNTISPSIDNVGITMATCGNSDGAINITASGGNGTLTYSINNGMNFQNGNIFANLSAGTYTIIVKDASGCETSQTTQLNTSNGPIINAINTTNPTCSLSNGGIAIVAANGSAPYTFSIDNGVTYQSSNNFTNLAAGSYTVVVRDNLGCEVSQQVSLSTTNNPTIIAGENKTICLGESVTLSASGGVSYVWSDGVINGQSFTPTTTNTYSVTGTDANGCSSTASVTITVIPRPIADFTSDVTEGDPVLVVTFSNNSSNATGYVWNFGNGSTSITTNSIGDQIGNFNTPGIYTVQLTASNGVCLDIYNMPITVFGFPDVEIHVPNVFTPDNDKINDEFFIDVKNGKTIQVVIYNRWGNTMYQISDFKDKWDGTHATDGVYFFTYEITDFKDKIHTGHGHVTLKR